MDGIECKSTLKVSIKIKSENSVEWGGVTQGTKRQHDLLDTTIARAIINYTLGLARNHYISGCVLMMYIHV